MKYLCFSLSLLNDYLLSFCYVANHKNKDALKLKSLIRIGTIHLKARYTFLSYTEVADYANNSSYFM